ncbi:MAG: DMT family transporter [Deltaproteobacteria bacterium]|nr:DMT family transporter [Deltaproteobacteria bacterium]
MRARVPLDPVGLDRAAIPIAVVAISFAAIFFRLAAPTPPAVASGWRLAVAALVLAPWWVRPFARDARFRRCALVAGAFYGLHFGTWVASLGLTSVAASVTLVTTTPLLLAAHSLVTGHDRPRGRVWVALAIGAAGIAIMSTGYADAPPGTLLGNALAFAGAIAMAGFLTTARGAGADLDARAFTGAAAAVGAALLLGFAIVRGDVLVPPSRAAAGFIVLAALIPQLIGHTLLVRALRDATPLVVSMAVVGEPAGATLLAWWWLGEGVGAVVGAGCAITLFAVILTSVSKNADETARI